MEFGTMMMATTTFAGGVGLLIWAISKFAKWKKTPSGDLAVAAVVAAVGITMVTAGDYNTFEFVWPNKEQPVTKNLRNY